jgi:hypothetical protein
VADTPETTAEETPAEEAPVPPQLYKLKSVVREAHNRTARAQIPGRRPLVTRLLGGVLTIRRGKPVTVTADTLQANLVEIQRAVALHQIMVTTLDDRGVDLETFLVAPAEPPKTQPHPPLDSAQNDKNEGVGYKVPPTPEGTTSDQPMPELLSRSSVHELEPIADTDRAASIPPSMPPPEPDGLTEPQLPSPALPEKKAEHRGKHRGKG